MIKIYLTKKIDGHELPVTDFKIGLNVGQRGKDAVVPEGIVVDHDYVHTDNNYTDAAVAEVAKIADKANSSDLTTALGNKADLVSGLVPSSQLPSYVDDVIEVANFAVLPLVGESGKIYITQDDNLTYRWSGTGYAEISKSLALGETSGTAYRGDRGKTAYDHSQTTGNPHGTTASDVGAQEPLDFVTETENKFLRDDNTFQEIPTPAGGYANNLYLGETDSDVPTYKILTYTADVAETLKTVTAQQSDGVVTAQTFLYPSGVSVSNFPSGLWSLKLWGKISASAGVSQVGFTYFKRSTLGVETDLFTLWSEEVNNTTDSWIDLVGTQPSYSVDPTDRMGLRLLFKTSSGTNKTLTYSIGDGYAAFVNNPNQIRHSQTRDKNGEEAFQHIDTTTTKATLAVADKVALYDSVTGKVVLSTILGDINTALETILAIEV